MTIDERLEALVARHEALAQSCQLIAGMQKTTERQLNSLVSIVDGLAQIVKSNEQRIEGMEGRA